MPVFSQFLVNYLVTILLTLGNLRTPIVILFM